LTLPLWDSLSVSLQSKMSPSPISHVVLKPLHPWTFCGCSSGFPALNVLSVLMPDGLSCHHEGLLCNFHACSLLAAAAYGHYPPPFLLNLSVCPVPQCHFVPSMSNAVPDSYFCASAMRFLIHSNRRLNPGPPALSPDPWLIPVGLSSTTSVICNQPSCKLELRTLPLNSSKRANFHCIKPACSVSSARTLKRSLYFVPIPPPPFW
jgi:hypothetical protein